MPLDPLAKRFLAMMAAGLVGAIGRLPAWKTVASRLPRSCSSRAATAPRSTRIDGVLPGPAGDIPYRLYIPGR